MINETQYVCCVFLFALVLINVLRLGCRRNLDRWVSPEGKMTGAFLWLLGELVPLGGLSVYLLVVAACALLCVPPDHLWSFLCVCASRFLDDFFALGMAGFSMGPAVGFSVWMLSLRPAYWERNGSL